MKKQITLVTAVYNEEEGLPAYVEAVTKTLLSNERYRDRYDFRVLFVDDGSSDRSWWLIQGICARDPRFGALRLARNMGPHIADSAALENAEGDAVILIACDLQDPPETAHDFIAAWEQGAQIVWGHRQFRKDEFWRAFASRIFNWIIRKIAMPKASKYSTGGFFLADRKVIDCFCQFRERNRIIFALIAWTGFNQAVVPYERPARKTGKSGWSLGRMIKSAYDVIIGYSAVPIRMITLIGVGLFLATIPISAVLLYYKITGSPLRGWTGLILAIVVFFGVQFLLTGLMGEYLYRIYSEVIGRPLYFVSENSGNATVSRKQRDTA